MSTEVPRDHLSRFLALAGYRSRKWIVDSKWHFLRRINASEISSWLFLNESGGGCAREFMTSMLRQQLRA